jgi:hypothetical protein
MDDGARRPGRFLISYAQEGAEHRALVHQFCLLLRGQGLDVRLDAFAGEERQDWPQWMARELAAAERVLVVVSAEYRARFDGTAAPGVGLGLRLEASLIKADIARDPDATLRKYLPVLLPGATAADIPDLLSRAATHYPVSELTAAGVERVVRLLRRDPRVEPEPPALGTAWPAAEPVAALHLDVHGGYDAEEVVAAFPTSTVDLAGPPPAVVDSLTRAARTVRAALRRVGGGAELFATIGGDVADHGTAAEDGAMDLATSAVGRRMHAAPGPGLVVVVSTGLHRFVASSTSAFPASRAYAELPVHCTGGRPVRVAVAGRSQCPPLPDPPSREPGRGGSDVVVSGPNYGMVGDHNTLINNGVIVQRDAYLTFGRPG